MYYDLAIKKGTALIIFGFTAYIWIKQVCFVGCVQTLPSATLPIGKNYPFSKIAVAFEPMMPFLCSLRFKMYFIFLHSLCYYWKHHGKPFGCGGAIKLWEIMGHCLMNHLMNLRQNCWYSSPWLRPGMLKNTHKSSDFHFDQFWVNWWDHKRRQVLL